MKYIKAKKHLGQHFLKDEDIARKIVHSISDEENKIVVEIGPGMGVLTKFLLEKQHFRVWTIEIDKEAIRYLHENFPKLANRIIDCDVLKFNFKEKFKEKISIIGNLPYYISSQIFFQIINNKNIIDEAVCMVQKEVAERIAASPGSKTYGLLSVSLQVYYSIDYLFTVDENVFHPPPKVKSAVIKLKRNSLEKLNCDEKLFKKVVKTCFNQRRKTIRNSIKSIVAPASIESEWLAKRPEELSVDDFVNLTRLVGNSIEKNEK